MERDEPSPRRRLIERFGFAAFCVAILAAAVISGLGGGKVDRVGEGFDPPATATRSVAEAVPLPPPEPGQRPVTPARALFAEACGTCHTLTPAGTQAPIGPNLDRARLSRAGVLSRIRDGSLDSSMPAGLLTGADAERVAAYVARVSGSRR